jgi:RNA polymerase sigma factor FliA
VDLGTTFGPGESVTDDDLVVQRLVDETMTRVPSSVDRSALEQAARSAVLEHRLSTDLSRDEDGAYGDAALVAAVRYALVEQLRASYAATAVPPEVVPLGIVRVAELATGLPALERRVVEGYFLEDLPVAELAAELQLTVEVLAAVRSAALRWLRDESGMAATTVA